MNLIEYNFDFDRLAQQQKLAPTIKTNTDQYEASLSRQFYFMYEHFNDRTNKKQQQ